MEAKCHERSGLERVVVMGQDWTRCHHRKEGKIPAQNVMSRKKWPDEWVRERKQEIAAESDC